MLYFFCFRIITYEIIVLSFPRKPPRTDMIILSAMSQFHFFLFRPLKILKLNFSIFRYCIVNSIYRIVDTFIHRFNSPGNINLSLQCHCLIFADHFLYFLNQCIAFSLCNKFRWLNCIYQKFQFCKFKRAIYNMVLIIFSCLFPLNFYAHLFQIFQITVNTFSFCCYSIFFQLNHNFRHCHIMAVICILLHNLCKSVQFKLLICTFRHIPFSLFHCWNQYNI